MTNSIPMNAPVAGRAPTTSRGTLYAAGAAVLAGASTPLAQVLLDAVDPLMLAALLNLGSGAGLLLWRALRAFPDGFPEDSATRRESGQDARPPRTRGTQGRADADGRRGSAAEARERPSGKALSGQSPRHEEREAPLTRADLPWLVGAILAGGVLAPVLLFVGMAQATAASASLLLNLEGVFTVLLAWVAFRERFDRRVALGMAVIAAGAVTLSWHGHAAVHLAPRAFALILGASLLWAVDANLTRKVAASDPLQIAAAKGLTAGAVNLVVALLCGASLPSPDVIAKAAVVGFVSYGACIVLYVMALRHVGIARTSACYSLAPFFGTALSALLGERLCPGFAVAALFMAAGVCMVSTNRTAPAGQPEQGRE